MVAIFCRTSLQTCIFPVLKRIINATFVSLRWKSFFNFSCIDLCAMDESFPGFYLNSLSYCTMSTAVSAKLIFGLFLNKKPHIRCSFLLPFSSIFPLPTLLDKDIRKTSNILKLQLSNRLKKFLTPTLFSAKFFV